MRWTGKSRAAATVFVALLLAAVLPACSPSAPPSSGLEINHSMTVQNFSGGLSSVAIVSGSAVNNGDKPIQSLTISVIFYDKDGKVMDQGSAVTGNMAPGAMWNFSVQSKGTDAWKIITYKLTSSVSR
jgi:hypothetical protein